MATSKYLNSELILKYIEIFHKLSARYKRIISIEMCKNRALTIHTVMAYSEVHSYHHNLESFFTSRNSKYMNINYILNHPELSWNWNFVSHNLSVTMEVVLLNLDKPWHWGRLSSHPNITMSDIESHLYLSWEWEQISMNPNLTFAMIDEHNIVWDWLGISENIHLTVDLLYKAECRYEWEFEHMSRWNPSITLELLLATPDLPWDYGCSV